MPRYPKKLSVKRTSKKRSVKRTSKKRSVKRTSKKRSVKRTSKKRSVKRTSKKRPSIPKGYTCMGRVTRGGERFKSGDEYKKYKSKMKKRDIKIITQSIKRYPNYIKVQYRFCKKRVSRPKTSRGNVSPAPAMNL